jgi:hypothetical protein
VDGGPFASVATAPFQKRASHIYLISGFWGELRPRPNFVLKKFYKKSSKCNLPLAMTCNVEQKSCLKGAVATETAHCCTAQCRPHVQFDVHCVVAHRNPPTFAS